MDGKPIPFSVNSTISYSSEDKQNGSLYNKVRVSTVDISRSRQTDVLEIGSTALVEKGADLSNRLFSCSGKNMA